MLDLSSFAIFESVVPKTSKTEKWNIDFQRQEISLIRIIRRVLFLKRSHISLIRKIRRYKKHRCGSHFAEYADWNLCEVFSQHY